MSDVTSAWNNAGIAFSDGRCHQLLEKVLKTVLLISVSPSLILVDWAKIVQRAIFASIRTNLQTVQCFF